MPEIVAENISIVETKELERFSRIDAEYYQPKYLALQKLYKKGIWSPIGQHLKACEYGLSIAMNTEGNGYAILRMDNLQGGFAFDGDIKYAPITEKEFYKYKLQKNDILFNRVNSEEFVGRTGIYKLSGNHVFASYLVRCQTKESELLPDYLNIFLNTKYGILSIRRMSRRAVNQANVNAQELKAIKILLAPLKFQEEIKDLLEKSHGLFEKSKISYSQAEALLVEKLGIKDIDLSHEPCYEVNSADTIAANRIDAEYYQPKYERVIEAIKKHPYKSIGDMFHLIKGIEPGSSAYCEEGKPFIRVSNLNKFEINNGNQQYLSEKTYSELKANYQPLKGEILLSKDATPGIAYHLKDQIDGIISSGILRLQALSNIKREYICLVINSLVGQSQIERDSGGSVINHWKPSQVQKTLIPMLSDKIQEKIELLCLESHSARRQAKELLEEAKRKVEEMIEKGENS